MSAKEMCMHFVWTTNVLRLPTAPNVSNRFMQNTGNRNLNPLSVYYY